MATDLSPEQIELLLQNHDVGVFSTVGADGYPYSVPLHFAYHGGKLYFHGRVKGRKHDNLAASAKSCFVLYNPGDIVHADNSCSTNMIFESVLITGQTQPVDISRRAELLELFVKKFTPQHAGAGFTEARVNATAVLEMTIETVTGKEYKRPGA